MSQNLHNFKFPPIKVIKTPQQLKSSSFAKRVNDLYEYCRERDKKRNGTAEKRQKVLVYLHAWYNEEKLTSNWVHQPAATNRCTPKDASPSSQKDDSHDDSYDFFEDMDNEQESQQSSHWDTTTASTITTIYSNPSPDTKTVQSSHTPLASSPLLDPDNPGYKPAVTDVQCFLFTKLPTEPDHIPSENCYILDFRCTGLLEAAYPLLHKIMEADCFKVFFDSREQGYMIDYLEMKHGVPFRSRPMVDLAVLHRKLFPMYKFCTLPEIFLKLYNGINEKLMKYIQMMRDGYVFTTEWTQEEQEVAAFPCAVFPQAYILMEKHFAEQGKSVAFIGLVRKESRLMYSMYISDQRKGSKLHTTLQLVKEEDEEFADFREMSIIERFGFNNPHVAVSEGAWEKFRKSRDATTLHQHSSRNASAHISHRTSSNGAPLDPRTTTTPSDLQLDDSNFEDMERLLQTMPAQMRVHIEPYVDRLIEIVLDYARPLIVRVFTDEKSRSMEDIELEYNDGRPLNYGDIDHIVQSIAEAKGEDVEELFREDNRCGVNGTLHRISAIRNRLSRVIGLTMRIGRVCRGCFPLIQDLVEEDKSILIVGRPGCGKTSLLRQIAKYTSTVSKERVIIVDTSNEIAGDGDQPHREIGKARRLQVQSIRTQDRVMLEAIANHTPQRLIIDEISTRSEANSASTISQRGIRIVATAHGNNLESLMKNKDLSTLLGGFTSVTLGDATALAVAKKQKLNAVKKTTLARQQPPVFDVVVDMRSYDSVAIFDPLTERIDELLESQSTWVEVRTQVDQGEIQTKHERFTIKM